MNSVIYLIVNLINNKIYVGSAVDFEDRVRLHKLHFSRGSHHNRHLQAAWDLYGEDVFKFVIVEYTHNLLEREEHWIKKLNATDPSIGYNICAVARNRRGVKASDETRLKLSESHKGHKQSEEIKAKRRLIMKGNQFNTGKKQSEEHIAKRVKHLIGKKHDKPRNRNIADWPCVDGRKCKCETCMEKKREYKRNWRKSQIGIDISKNVWA